MKIALISGYVPLPSIQELIRICAPHSGQEAIRGTLCTAILWKRPQERSTVWSGVLSEPVLGERSSL